MKIALFNTLSPYIRGGAEILVDDLQEELQKRGHQVTLFGFPFPDDYEVSLMETIAATKLLDFSDYDKLICFKFPAFYAAHKEKNLWFFHQFRQVYELYDEEYGLKSDGVGAAIKAIVEQNDTEEIGNAHKVYTNAVEVTNRLKKYNHLNSEIINPPLKNWEAYHCKEYGDFIYYPSRVTDLKRQSLAVEAMKYTNTPVQLVIDGSSPSEAYTRAIHDTIRKNHLENRVVWENRWISDEDKIQKMSTCLACLYLAYQEDSCGFVSMEGFYSSKPVISLTDSGGTHELIEHGRTGLFAEPTPKALAKAMDALYENREKTMEMGQAAREEIIKRDYTWDRTVRRLLV